MLAGLATVLASQSKYTRLYLFSSETNPNPSELFWLAEEFGYLNDGRNPPTDWTVDQIHYFRDVVFKDVVGMKTYVDWGTLQKFLLVWGDHTNFDATWTQTGENVYRLTVTKVNVAATMDSVIRFIDRVPCSVRISSCIQDLTEFKSFEARVPERMKFDTEMDEFTVFPAEQPLVTWTDEDVTVLKRMFNENPWIFCCTFYATHDEYTRFVSMFQPTYKTQVYREEDDGKSIVTVYVPR